MIDAVGNPQAIALLGGTSEIGLAIVDRYVAAAPRSAKPRVVLAGRASENLSNQAVRLREVGCEVKVVDFDAADPASHRTAIDQVFAPNASGSNSDIDVAIVAFGLLGDAERAWQDVNHAVELAQVNYVGAVSVGVLLSEHLRKQGHGTIVALSSVAGERIRRSNFVYGSTKAGMDGFYEGLGEALRPHGVNVLVVRPGFVKTKLTAGMESAPLAVTPQQVADAVHKAVAANRSLIWVPAQFRPVMSALRHVPRPVFRKLPV